MTNPPKDEGPEVAASEPSEPTASNEQIGNTIMAQHNDYPVDPTGPLTTGTIPEADLDRMIAATVPAPKADEPYSYSDATWPEDGITVRIAKDYRFNPDYQAAAAAIKIRRDWADQ